MSLDLTELQSSGVRALTSGPVMLLCFHYLLPAGSAERPLAGLFFARQGVSNAR